MGEARSSRPWDNAGASLPKNFFRPFGSQFGIQIRPWDKGRGHCPKTFFSGPPGPLSWILHCLSILLSLSPSSSPPPYALLLILPPLNSSTSYSRSFFHFYFPMSFPTLSFPLSLSRPLTSSLSHSSSPDSAFPSLCPHSSFLNILLLLLHPSLSPFPLFSFLSLSSASASSSLPVNSHRSPSIIHNYLLLSLLSFLLLIPSTPNLIKQNRKRPNSTIFCFVIIHLCRWRR